MTKRDIAIEEARAWTNSPWRHQGRTRFGVDCVGLIAGAMAPVVGADEVAKVDRVDYSRRPRQYEFVKIFESFCDRILLQQVQPGDLLVFADGPYPCHVAMLTDLSANTMIHASARLRKVSEEQFSEFWRQKLTHCFTPWGYK